MHKQIDVIDLQDHELSHAARIREVRQSLRHNMKLYNRTVPDFIGNGAINYRQVRMFFKKHDSAGSICRAQAHHLFSDG